MAITLTIFVIGFVLPLSLYLVHLRGELRVERAKASKGARFPAR